MGKVSIIIMVLMLFSVLVSAASNQTNETSTIGNILVDTEQINLSSIKIETDNNIYFDEMFKITAIPLNSNATVIGVDTLTIMLLDVNIKNEGTLSITLDKIYTKRFMVENQDIENITILVYAKQGEKEINVTETFYITQKSFTDNSKNMVGKFGTWFSDFIFENWLYLVIFGILFIFIAIALSLIKKVNNL